MYYGINKELLDLLLVLGLSGDGLSDAEFYRGEMSHYRVYPTMRRK